MQQSTVTRKRIGRDLPNGDYIEITAEERDSSGRLSPGFSITLAGWEKRGTWSGRAAARNHREETFGGADHETILRVAPELAPIVTAHLSDPDGTPMHAVANGWYFYSGASSNYERAQIRAGKDYGYSRNLKTSDHDRAARSLNIDPELLPTDLDQTGFRRFCDGLAGTVWPAQAAAARAALAAMVDGEGVEITP